MARRVWRVVGLSGVGALALAAAFGTGARWSSDHGSDVALPPDDATPGQVVQAYLDAVNADDERVLRAVTTPGMFDEIQEAWLKHSLYGLGSRSGYGHPTITNVLMGEDAAAGTDLDPDRAAMAAVSFEMQGGDATVGPGDVTWGIFLERADASSPWLVYDQGQG
ncbi:DUF4829 domain-containing protein [Luteimicrobium album]|nr:DUF4829 domain-containing protein [Luteimicrobium album]